MTFQKEDWGSVIGAGIGILILASFFFMGKTGDPELVPLVVSTEQPSPLPLPTKDTEIQEELTPPSNDSQPSPQDRQEIPPQETQKKEEPSRTESSSHSGVSFSIPTTIPALFESTFPPSLSSINVSARAAAVNIFCLPGEGRSYGASGSGIIIDPRGIILTNAHVAYHLLLEDVPQKDSLECEIRTGNPAVSKYEAQIVFMPLSWAYENIDALMSSKPSGTGEHDYALLVITKSLDGSPLPTSFSFVPIAGEYDLEPGDTTVVAGYPAGFLSGETITRSLPLTSAYATVKDVFTFETTTVDVLSLGGSPVAQQGVSGSALVDARGNVAGIAVTSSQEATTNERDLRAITTRHITRSFASEAGMRLSEFLQYDTPSLIKLFEGNATKLRAILRDTVE